MKNVGEPCAGEPHARFDAAAGGNQASRLDRAAPAPPADPTATGRVLGPRLRREARSASGGADARFRAGLALPTNARAGTVWRLLLRSLGTRKRNTYWAKADEELRHGRRNKPLVAEPNARPRRHIDSRCIPATGPGGSREQDRAH